MQVENACKAAPAFLPFEADQNWSAADGLGYSPSMTCWKIHLTCTTFLHNDALLGYGDVPVEDRVRRTLSSGTPCWLSLTKSNRSPPETSSITIATREGTTMTSSTTCGQ